MDLSENTPESLKQDRAALRREVHHAGDPAAEIKNLRHCINDLTSVMALPAVWRKCDAAQVSATFADSLMAMLNLDFIYVGVPRKADEAPIEVLRVGAQFQVSDESDQLSNLIAESLKEGEREPLRQERSQIGNREIGLVRLGLGSESELGGIVMASQRVDFPQQTESLLLRVAASQLVIELQQAQRLKEQRRVAGELDRQVAERTRELVVTNEELQLQVGLLQDLPVSAWTLEPDGTPDFVNRVWLDFSGQTLDFIRSDPEAWMAVVHPEDREAAAKAFWYGVHSGKDFAFETRSLRARDGTWRWHLQQAVVLRDGEGKVLKFVGTTTDIHEQKQAQRALRASELSLRHIIDDIPGLVSTLGPNGEPQLVNRQILQYFGKTLDDLKNWQLSDAIHPDDLPRIIDLHVQAIKRGISFGGEYRLRRVDGVYRWFQFRAEHVRDAAAGVSGWLVLATDIHDRKQAEEALLASERTFASIINTIPTLTWSARPDGSCDFLSRGWLDFTGLSLDQARGWGWATAVHPEDRAKLVERWQGALESGTLVDTEARLRRFDGVYRWTLIRANPWLDDSGSIAKWYGTNTDIDDRKRAEEQVQRSEGFLAEAQHLTRVGSFAWCVSTGEIRWSEQLYRIFECEPGTPVTVALVRDYVHPNDQSTLTATIDEALRAVSDIEKEYRIVMRDGSIKHLHFLAHATRDREGRLEYIGAIQDVTQRHLAEEALASARAELANVTRVISLGMLTASVAHEINQPLSGIITNASTCLRMLNADPPNVDGARETTARALRDGNRVSDVITRLRTLFTRKEVKSEPLDVTDIAREVTALYLTELQKNHVTLRQEFVDGLPTVTGDRVQLQQVILNLIRNASDAMNAVEDRPREMLVSTERVGNEVHFKVRDAGTGIDPVSADRLFEPFYTTKEDGMGIGLSVSRSIIEAHDGRLWAMANDGPGATFAFSIPWNRPPETASDCDDI